MIRLKERLSAVFSEIEPGSRVADIGCDHGKLSCKLLQEGIASKVIACDISEESLSKAIELKDKIGLSNFEARVGDGLSVIGKDEVDTVVIAGMGGMEIIKILSNATNTFSKYIFVPHSNEKELRIFLMDKFLIKKDYLVKENNKFYNVLVIVPGKSNLTSEQIEFGMNENNPLLYELAEKKLNDFNSYLASAEDKTELLAKIAMFEKVLQNGKSKRNN